MDFLGYKVALRFLNGDESQDFMASKLVVKPFEHDFFYNDVFDKFSQVNKENNKLTQWKFP